MQSVDVIRLKEMIAAKEHFLLIDVREPHEHAAFNIGGELMPLSTLAVQLHRIPTGTDVVIYCQKGVRSVIAIQKLQDKLPGNHLINLSGGIQAWIKAFGPTSP